MIKHFKRKSFRITHSFDDSRVIFPLCFKTYQFKARHYRPYMTQNKITSMELDTFFEEVYANTDNFAVLRKWTASFLFALSGLCLVNILATFLYPCIAPIDKKIFIKSLLPEVIVGINMIGFVLSAIASLRIQQRNNKKARESVEEIIQARADYFMARGLKWELPDKSMDFLALVIEDGNYESPFEFNADLDLENNKKHDLHQSLLQQDF